MTDPGYETAAAAGIHRIAIPTPFAVGRVNAYLIDDRPLTLVDTGPNSGTSYEELQRGIETLGHRLEDVELVILTHQHIDHLGLAGVVASRSGAEVAAIDAAVPFVERYSEEAAAEDAFAVRLMLRHGVPPDLAAALETLSGAFRAWGARSDVARVMRDGDRLELRDRVLEVRLRPGHSPTDTLFHDVERRMLFAGDHLLRHISSNALISRARDGSERRQALVEYIASLEDTRELELDLVLPGHGDAITSHRPLIDERFALHRRRAGRLRRLIEEQPRTAYELARALWGEIRLAQAFLTLSEVLGHTDLLVGAGHAREVHEDGVVRFYPASSAPPAADTPSDQGA